MEPLSSQAAPGILNLPCRQLLALSGEVHGIPTAVAAAIAQDSVKSRGLHVGEVVTFVAFDTCFEFPLANLVGPSTQFTVPCGPGPTHVQFTLF